MIPGVGNMIKTNTDDALFSLLLFLMATRTGIEAYNVDSHST